MSKEAVNEARALELFLKNTPHVYHLMEHSNIEEGITNFLKNERIDLLAAMPRKHKFLQKLFKSSVTKQLVHHSKVPLLTFPAT